MSVPGFSCVKQLLCYLRDISYVFYSFLKPPHCLPSSVLIQFIFILFDPYIKHLFSLCNNKITELWLLKINFSWGRSIMEWVRKNRKRRGGIFSRKMRHWRCFALVLFFLQSYPFPVTFEWKRYLEFASITCCVGQTPMKCILESCLLGSSSKY